METDLDFFKILTSSSLLNQSPFENELGLI